MWQKYSTYNVITGGKNCSSRFCLRFLKTTTPLFQHLLHHHAFSLAFFPSCVIDATEVTWLTVMPCPSLPRLHSFHLGPARNMCVAKLPLFCYLFCLLCPTAYHVPAISFIPHIPIVPSSHAPLSCSLLPSYSPFLSYSLSCPLPPACSGLQSPAYPRQGAAAALP